MVSVATALVSVAAALVLVAAALVLVTAVLVAAVLVLVAAGLVAGGAVSRHVVHLRSKETMLPNPAIARPSWAP